MIKKLIMLGLATVFSAFPLTKSYAYSQASKIYIGADYVYSDIKYRNDTIYEMDDPYSSISPVIGFNAYGIGLEGFYQFSDKQINKSGYESTLKAYGIDLVGEALTRGFVVWRMRRDLNPRYGSPRINDFESLAFSLSATHP